MKHGPKTILLKLLTILLSGSPYQWWTRQQGTAGLIPQQSQLKRSMSPARRPFRATSARTVELAGTNQFQMFATVNTKKLLDLTSQSCNTRERALGSLPANRAFNSDQVISLHSTRRCGRACTWSGPKVSSCKHQASSKYQAFEPTCSIAKRQASQPE